MAMVEQEADLAQQCKRRGVRWEISHWEGNLSAWVRRFFEPHDLLIFGRSLPSSLKKELFRQTTTMLVCPDQWMPASRMLIVDQGRAPIKRFLGRTAELARALGVEPIVLTVARTEREARQNQQAAREVLTELRLSGDFDFVVGFEVRTAVATVARWRHAQLIAMERSTGPAWWRWVRGDSVQQFADVFEVFSFLALPEVSAADSAVACSPAPVFRNRPAETGQRITRPVDDKAGASGGWTEVNGSKRGPAVGGAWLADSVSEE
jgi:hypothetical protein